MEPTRDTQVLWKPSRQEGIDVITEELMANAARMATYIRSNLTLPNCTINDDIAALEIDWVDGPAQLPPDALHFLDEAFHFFGLACEIRRTLSAVVFGAAAIHQHVHGQHDGPAALLSATCDATKDRDWFTDTPYGRHRTQQAEALRKRADVPGWGVVDPDSPADFGVALIDALITIDADRIDEDLGIGGEHRGSDL